MTRFSRILVTASALFITACTASPPQTAPAESQPIAYKLEDGRMTTELALDPGFRSGLEWPVETKRALIDRGRTLADEMLERRTLCPRV